MQAPPDVCVLVADYGVGDHYIVAALAADVRSRYGLRIWLAGKARLAFLSGLFPAAERYLTWPENLNPAQLVAKQVRGGTFFHAHFPGLELMRAVGYNRFHFLDAYRCRLGLRPEAALSQARRPRSDEIEAARTTLRAHGFDPAESVLVCPEARTTPTDGVGPEFWAALYAGLAAAGLRPVVNASPNCGLPDGVGRLSPELSELRALAGACAGVCSIRSGFSDLVCDLPMPGVVIYPQVRYWAGTLLEGTTFDRYGLAAAPTEIVVTPGVAAVRAGEIVDILTQGAAHGAVDLAAGR